MACLWRSGSLLLTCLLLLGDSLPAQAPFEGTVLESSTSFRWYKGNLHAHSNWSDGDDYMENIALWYREQGYHFLSLTDHNIIAEGEKWVTPEVAKGGWVSYDKLLKQFPGDWIVTRHHSESGKFQVKLKTFLEVSKRLNRPGEYLLIKGEEISDSFDQRPIHMNAVNLEELIQPRRGKSTTEVMQNNVDALLAQRERTGKAMMIHLNHPNFVYAVTAEDLMPVIGEKFFEVYNGHPQVHNLGDAQRAGTERIWDIVNAFRLGELDLPLMYGLGVDDGHDYHDRPGRNSRPGRGWVMVLADKLESETLVHALEAGRFYASSGVTLKKVVSSPDLLAVEVDPVPGETYTIEFIGTPKNFDRSSQPVVDKNGEPIHTTRVYSSDIGKVLARVEGTSGRYELKGDKLYVRARVISSAEHANPSEPGEFKMAWVQPVLGPKATSPE